MNNYNFASTEVFYGPFKDTSDFELFGNHIRTLRKSRHLSQQQLADSLGLVREAISKWENGKNLPDICNFFALSQALNVSLDVLNPFRNAEKEGRDTSDDVPLPFLYLYLHISKHLT